MKHRKYQRQKQMLIISAFVRGDFPKRDFFGIFLELKTRPARHCLMVFLPFFFFARPLIFTPKKCSIKNYPKIIPKTLLPFSFFGPPPLALNPSQGPFLTVIAMFYARRALFSSGWSRRHFTCPHAAKAKPAPHAMRSNIYMPSIRCLSMAAEQPRSSDAMTCGLDRVHIQSLL